MRATRGLPNLNTQERSSPGILLQSIPSNLGIWNLVWYLTGVEMDSVLGGYGS